jgi:hypothetical protein
MEEKDLFDRLRRFILKEAFLSDLEITDDTIIETEIGITGDDADEFINAFSNEFNVDVSNFEIGKYFKGEGDTTFINIFNFFSKKKPAATSLKLTVGDLKRAIIARKLDDTVIG